MLPVTLGFRFLFTASRDRRLRLFSFISILSVMCSVMLFLLINTVVNGLRDKLRDTWMGFEAPLTLSVGKHSEGFEKRLTQWLTETGSTSYSVSEFPGLIQSLGLKNASGVKVRAISTEFLEFKQDSLEIFWFGEASPSVFGKTDRMILLGDAVIKRLPVSTLNELRLSLIHPFGDFGPGGDIEPSLAEVTIAGAFRTGHVDFDDAYVFVNPQTMARLGNDVFLKKLRLIFPPASLSLQEAQSSWDKVKQSGDPDLLSWQDKNKNVIQAMELERLLYNVIFFFVLVIACVNLASLVSLFGLKHARDGAVLRAMGLSQKDLKRVYQWMGLLLAGSGGALGVIAAGSIVLFFQVTGLELPSSYGFTELPLRFNWGLGVALLLVSPLVGAVVAWWPSWEVSRRSVTQTLGWSS